MKLSRYIRPGAPFRREVMQPPTSAAKQARKELELTRRSVRQRAVPNSPDGLQDQRAVSFERGESFLETQQVIGGVL